MDEKAHITFKAVTTVSTDEGVFEAVISTATIDRELDIVEPQAMVDALQKWVPLGKKVPLRWNHGTRPEHVIGHIDPNSATIANNEVTVTGWVDQEAQLGGDAWRLVKSGTLGFSFGYMVTEGTKRLGGGTHITAMDVFEVTATPGPMNADTRVLAWKSDEEQREDAKRVAHAVEDSLLPAGEPEPPPPAEVDVPKELQEVKAMLAEMGDQIADLKKKVEETDQETKSRSVDPLQDNAMQTALGVLSGGAKAPKVTKEEPKPQPDQEPEELFKSSHDLMVRVLSGAKTD